MSTKIDSFKTILTISEGLYKEKGSKFMAFAIPVTTKEEVKDVVNSYKKKYFDARHVCYAYVLGHESNEFRANDDGEPPGTAGRPILGQIKSHQLTDILIIVVRYFGGILLGTGGLVSAYKEATNDAISNSTIIEKEIEAKVNIIFGFTQTNNVMRCLKDTNAHIVKIDYAENISLDFRIKISNLDIIKHKLLLIGNLIVTENC